MPTQSQMLESLQRQVDEMQRQMADFRKEMVSLADRSERIIIMMDRSNLDHTWRRLETDLRPDYLKIRDFLTGGRSLTQVRIYYSDLDEEVVSPAERSAWQGRQDFYHFLRCNGWILKGVRKRVYDGVTVEKGLDATLIRDMEKIGRDNRCDTVVLVAGDADYCDVVASVQEDYCLKVEVAFFPNQTARELRTKASRFIDLEAVKDQISRRIESR